MNKYVITGKIYVDSEAEYQTHAFYHIKDKDEVTVELNELRANSNKKPIYFCKIPIYPVGQYEILTLEEWFDKNCANL